MFSGIVEKMGTTADIISAPPGKRLVIRDKQYAGKAFIGESIAINGCCLTVVVIQDDTFAFDVGPETLLRTNLGNLAPGDQVNLERSLAVGDLVGGHFVTGHIDGIGTLDQRNEDGEYAIMWFRLPEPLTRQMISKGSIAIDGISFTLVDVEKDRFSVMVIPHTLAITTLGKLPIGGKINLETDVLAKYVQKAVAPE